MDPVADTLNEARQLHLTGQWAAAFAVYERVLSQHPESFDARQLLGTLCLQLGQPEAAIVHLSHAHALRPQAFFVLGNRGLAFKMLNQLSAALADLDEAIRLNPQYAEGINNRGLVHLSLGQWAESLVDFDNALAINSNALDALSNKGIVLQKLGRLEEACACFKEVVKRQPGMPEAYSNLASIQLERQLPKESLQLLEQALALKPDYIDAMVNLANTYLQLANPLKALEWAQRALQLVPGLATALRASGLSLKELERPREALACFDEVLGQLPNDVDALINRGNTRMALGLFQESLDDFITARRVSPASAPIWVDCANAYEELGDLESALNCLNEAIRLSPTFAEAYSNRGHIHHEKLDMPRAIADFNQALLLNPNLGDAHWNLGLARLHTGELREGFLGYEWRWKTERGAGRRFKREFKQPLWLGDADLSGRAILVYAEQGLGDSIQFARYLPLLNGLGATVIVEVQRALVPLFREHLLGGPYTVIAKGDALPEFDYQIAMLSLPLAFKTDLNSVPAQLPYFTVDGVRQARWRSVLGESGFKIAIAWKGNTRGLIDKRSFGLQHFAALASLPTVRLISLQKNAGSEELTSLARQFNVEHLNEPFDAPGEAFLDSSAVMSLADLIITSDTSLTHLAGALNRPCFLPLRYASEWRWLTTGSQSPWYPRHRLFRQPAVGDWDSVFADVYKAVSALIAGQP